MKCRELKELWKSDLYRYSGEISKKKLLKYYLNPGFKYSFYMRLGTYLQKNNRKILYILFRWYLNHLMFKYGISISPKVNIESGLYIGHFGNIFISVGSNIGKNFNISQGVTVGQTNRGNKKGEPTIGDNVYLGSGCKVIGNVRIGNNVCIGANAVVTKDIPDNAVAVGIPAKVISLNGSKGYIQNTDFQTNTQ